MTQTSDPVAIPYRANADRPFVIGTGATDPWSAEFGCAMADALDAGEYRIWRTDQEDQSVPLETGRFLEVDCAVPILPGERPRMHRIMIDWRSCDNLTALSGLVGGYDGITTPDGFPLSKDDATAAIARTSARIASFVLRAPLRDAAVQKDMTALLLAAAASCGAVDGDTMAVCVAPSPWGPSEIRHLTQSDKTVLVPEAGIEEILPCGVSVSVDRSTNNGSVIRIDAYTSTDTSKTQPGIVDAMRTLRRGWTHG